LKKLVFLITFFQSFGRALLCAFCFAPYVVNAHVVGSGQGIVNLVDTQAIVAISVPMKVFSLADDNGDGFIEESEIRAHQSQLIAKVRDGVRFSGDGQSANWKDIFLTPSLPDTDKVTTGPAEQRQMLVMGVASWSSSPRVVNLAYDLWSPIATTDLISQTVPRETLKVTAFRTEGANKVSEEVGLLSPNHPHLEFFLPLHRHIANFALHGFDHIMAGADHIVFLIALLASGISMRRWVSLLTAFTVAHGITFGLASMGWVYVPASLIEPAIAASIVVVSLLHLLKKRVELHWELILVFNLGLIHGLGFASAMQDDGASQAISLSPYPMWSILGFNLGIEAGQFAVAVLLYATILALRRMFRLTDDLVWQRAAGVFSVLIGSFWLIDRI
jgi:hydrogenase/urease accessory protein HupE